MQLNLICQDNTRSDYFTQLIEKWNFIHNEQADFSLILTSERLELYYRLEPNLGPVFVDWAAGAVAHRRRFGGGKNQTIAKAVGLNKGVKPTILDATAGLGRDAFIFASLGCQVTMFERNPVVAALLEDGYQRACNDIEIGSLVKDKIKLITSSSIEALTNYQSEIPDIIYLDPMYPHRKKSALVKKEMRVFQKLVGSDLDADKLLEPALKLAKYRVVVKRPSYAEPLNNINPTLSFATKRNRFDVYINASITK